MLYDPAPPESAAQSPRHPYAADAIAGRDKVGSGVRLGVDELLDIRKKSIPKTADVFIVSMRVSHMETLPFLQIELVKRADGWSFVSGSIKNGKVVGCPPGQYQGMLLYQDKPYLFYLEKDPDVVSRLTVKSGQRQWAAIAEILNQQRIYDTYVVPQVVSFFERNRDACYILDDDLQPIETPSIVYNGAYGGGITCAVHLGKERAGPYAKYGAFYYFGDFSLALRYACFTVNMESRSVKGEKITRGDSAVLKRGGIAKYVLREGRNVGLIRPHQPVRADWAETYDSLIQPGDDNCLYVAKLFEQQKLLSYVFVDTKDVKTTGKDTTGARII